MLEEIDLSRKISAADYKDRRDALELELAALQRRARQLQVPVLLLFAGWGAAGKGTMINKLILPLDPRGFNVYTALPPNPDEALRPFLWRFWIHTPAQGRIAIFDRGWYRRLLSDRVRHGRTTLDGQRDSEDVIAFERQLSDAGTVILKFFLHIDRKEQKRRFRKLARNPSTAWRVTDADLQQNRDYERWLQATEDVLSRTDSDYAPWVLVEARDERFAALKILTTAVNALARHLDSAETARTGAAAAAAGAEAAPPLPRGLTTSILDSADPDLTLKRAEYRDKLRKRQKRIRELQHEIYTRRVPVVILYEGWDAAGKGGNIRRLTQNLDPRGYQVVPVGPPNDTENAHHYLWRFWEEIPKAGHLTIFDRSWYGRVLVERVEEFCPETDWRRAYREINEMERHLTNFGVVLLKFWLHIDQAEQLRRFEQRQSVAHKQWKITDDDWRNREKWQLYKAAVEEMLFRTSTPNAPWTVVESNCKRYARIRVLDAVIDAVESQLDRAPATADTESNRKPA